MLISGVLMTEKGIRIYDVDGSSVPFLATDALDLLKWLQDHREQLLEIVRSEQATKRQQEQAQG